MAYQEVAGARTGRSRTYQDSEHPRKRVWSGGLARIAYDAGEEHLRPVNMTPERVVNAQFDGWRIDDAPWRYRLGQPAGRGDGWVVTGFQGAAGVWHDFGFRALGAIYWERGTGAIQRIGGEPDYNRGNIEHTPQTVTIGPNSDEIPVAASAEWANVWPGVDLRFSIDGYRLKEDVIISAATRAAIPTPGSFGMAAADTWFGIVYRVDWQNIPRVVRDNIDMDVEGEFFDLGLPVELRDAADRLLGFMPISDVYVETGDGERESLPLTKRFYKDGADWYLIIGAPVLGVASLPPGALHFDPTIEESVGANWDDALEGFSYGTWGTCFDEDPIRFGDYFSDDTIFGLRFTGISGLSGVTIDSAKLTFRAAATDTGTTISGRFWAHDVESPPTFANSAGQKVSNRTTTTAWVQANGSDFGAWSSGNDYDFTGLGSIIQELADSHDPSAIVMLWISTANNGGDDERVFVTYNGTPANAPTLTIEYTAGGGTDDLTAGDLALAAPVLDTPALGQVHALSAGDLTSTAPALDTPALNQLHALTTGDLTEAASVLDTPALGQIHTLAGGDLLGTAPALDTPALGQVHVLTVGDLLVAAPQLDTPALGQVHALTVGDLLLAAPILDTPTLGEIIYNLVAGHLALSAPLLDAPSLSQVHILTVGDLLATAPVLDTPTIGAITDALSVGDLTLAAPILDTPSLAQVHVLTVGDLLATAPILDSPALTQLHVLVVGDLLGAAPILDGPYLNRELAAGLMTVIIISKAPAVVFTAIQPDIVFTSKQPSIKIAA